MTVVPLPEHLLTCGCPHAKAGHHLTTCAPALEHEANPDRYKGHPDGTRFQAISWDFPIKVTAEITYEVSIDPVAFIEQHRDRYDRFEMEAGYQPWEKPMVFISSLIEEDAEALVGGWFGHPRHVSYADVRCVDIEEYPRWTKEDAERIRPPKPPVDPNQGVLLDDL